MALEWTDLVYVLAVHRARTLAAAARRLGCNQTTIGRRLEVLETALGARIFRRTPDGYLLTQSGESLLVHAERIETEVMAIERKVRGEDERPEGSVRLATFESMATCFVAPRLDEFHRRYPNIEVQLNVDNQPLNLARRDADLALRTVRPAQAALQIRKAGVLAAGLYASRAYLKAHGEPRTVDDLAGHELIADEETNAHAPLQRWLLTGARGARVVLRTNSTLAQTAACRAGVGIAVLYCYVGDTERGLERILLKHRFEHDLWIAVHRDLQYAGRVRALIDYLAEIAKRDRALLLGGPRA